MEHIDNMFESGRSSAAPKLATNAEASIQVVCRCSKSQICYCYKSGGVVCHSWKNDTSSAAMQHNSQLHENMATNPMSTSDRASSIIENAHTINLISTEDMKINDEHMNDECMNDACLFLSQQASGDCGKPQIQATRQS